MTTLTSYPDNVRKNEVEDIEFAFGILQSEKDKICSTQLGTILRNMKLNPSLDRLTQLGVAKNPGQKFFNLAEVVKIYADLKNEVKDMGCYEDFIECLKLYDKAENGRMLLSELQHSLSSLGEKLSEPEIDELFEDCLPEENDEGEIEYTPFLKAMCEVKG